MSTDSNAGGAGSGPPSEVEEIKRRSRLLRGTLAESLADPVTGAVRDEDRQLTKFHGIYQQDDRDLRADRAERKLEPAYEFMIRIAVPGGIMSPAQWQAVDRIAADYASAAPRLTTRQAIQLHGIRKADLKRAMREINEAGLTTLAACGDVNRNVVCSALPERSAVHRAVYARALEVADRLRPRTGAYRELWMDAPPAERGEEEPLYGSVYLPRKFKVGFAVPPVNDIDVYAQDIGFVAIVRDGTLAGFNVAVGGGLGMTHGDAGTYPRLGSTIGFCRPEQVVRVAEQVVAAQRDLGDRSNRSHARLKYTIDELGVEAFVSELHGRLGFELEPAAPVTFVHSGDPLGWVEGDDGRHYLTLFVPSGRVVDSDAHRFRTGVSEIAEAHRGELRVSANQNLIVAGVAGDDVDGIDAIARRHGLHPQESLSPLRRNAMSCVALPTCGLAMAESERYLPAFIDRLEPLLAKHGLEDEDISLRVTGCPNGCARPYLAEIALVGKAPGRYNLMLGGALTGERLNLLHAQNLDENAIVAELDRLLADFAGRREPGEPFGDFLRRSGALERDSA